MSDEARGLIVLLLLLLPIGLDVAGCCPRWVRDLLWPSGGEEPDRDRE